MRSFGFFSSVHDSRVVAITMYSPGCRPVIRYWPVSSVRLNGPPPATGVSRRWPRKYFHCMGKMLALGTGSPTSSVIRPTMAAVRGSAKSAFVIRWPAVSWIGRPASPGRRWPYCSLT
jgi:hypothetical protein